MHALEIGADDYLVKPFSMRELVARVGAAARRGVRPAEERRGDAIEIEELRIDPREVQAFVDGQSAGLTPTEFKLLYTLALDRGRVVTRDELLQKVWGRRETHRDRTVDVFVRRLRQKIDRIAPTHSFIQTRFGVGYKLEPEAEVASADGHASWPAWRSVRRRRVWCQSTIFPCSTRNTAAARCRGASQWWPGALRQLEDDEHLVLALLLDARDAAAARQRRVPLHGVGDASRSTSSPSWTISAPSARRGFAAASLSARSSAALQRARRPRGSAAAWPPHAVQSDDRSARIATRLIGVVCRAWTSSSRRSSARSRRSRASSPRAEIEPHAADVGPRARRSRASCSASSASSG